ncbi:hypothetical protein FBU59_002632, partial [Linderina macrospora]
MDSRKEELEKKRAKLAELRRQREERKRAALQSQQQSTASSSRLDTNDINDLVNSLVGDRARSPSIPQHDSEPMSPVASSFSAHVRAAASAPRSDTPDSMSTGVMSPRPVAQQRLVPEFTTTETVIFDFAPKEKVAYNKETQTSEAVAEDTELLAEEEVERRVREIREKDEK